MRVCNGEVETMLQLEVKDSLERLTSELRNFEDIASYLKPKPGEVPKLEGIDIYGETLPLNGLSGGDHIIYVDFKQRYDFDAKIAQAMAEGRQEVVENLLRCQKMAGIAVIDVSGHQVTDALLAAMLHQAFLLGSTYELDLFGQITSRLFENLNTRFYNSSGVHKFLTMIYGEISEDSTFRFLSAAHPHPVVFSSLNDRFMEVSKESCTTFPPVGTMPSENLIERSTTESVLGIKQRYELNEWQIMGTGDILLLYTDGLLEHSNNDRLYFPRRLERTVRDVKHSKAKEIVEAIKADLLAFNDPDDDISIVVIKRT
jgi:serine phosphatase RsbU (regulator of sigma subunit)